jgi:DnaJ-class molecular chaperone
MKLKLGRIYRLNVRCSYCEGTGTVMVPPYPDERCKRCEGRGTLLHPYKYPYKRLI